MFALNAYSPGLQSTCALTQPFCLCRVVFATSHFCPMHRIQSSLKTPWPLFREKFIHPHCYGEFVLEHSPSVSVCSRLFSALLSYSCLLFCPSPSPFVPSVSVLCFRLSVSSFQLSTLGSDPFLVSSNLAFILLLLLFGYNPYQPNPIAPRFLIVSVL